MDAKKLYQTLPEVKSYLEVHGLSTNCEYCGGTGIVSRQNGPDDIDSDACEYCDGNGYTIETNSDELLLAAKSALKLICSYKDILVSEQTKLVVQNLRAAIDKKEKGA